MRSFGGVGPGKPLSGMAQMLKIHLKWEVGFSTAEDDLKQAVDIWGLLLGKFNFSQIPNALMRATYL